MTDPNKETVSIFDMSAHGRLPAMLRELAAQIDSGEMAAERMDWTNSDGGTFEISLRLAKSGVAGR